MTTIPQPKTFGPLGNLPLIDKERPIQSFVKLADEYGPIFDMDLPSGSRASSLAFPKSVIGLRPGSDIDPIAACIPSRSIKAILSSGTQCFIVIPLDLPTPCSSNATR